MIIKDREVKILNAASKKNWRIRPVGSPVLLYQYIQNFINNSPLMNINDLGEISYKSIFSRYYFRAEEASNSVPGFIAKRMAAFVINNTEWNQRDLDIFLFPMSIYKKIKESKLFVGKYDWNIIRHGEGLSTRYDCTPVEKTKITKTEANIVRATVKNVSLHDALVRQKKCFTQISYTSFNRFEIMDL